MAIARYTLAVDRRGEERRKGPSQQAADLSIVFAADQAAEVGNVLFPPEGCELLVSGRLQTGAM